MAEFAFSFDFPQMYKQRLTTLTHGKCNTGIGDAVFTEDGYSFREKYRKKTGERRWVCTRMHCRCVIMTEADAAHIMQARNYHCHPPDRSHIAKRRLRTLIKQDVDSPARPEDVVLSALKKSGDPGGTIGRKEMMLLKGACVRFRKKNNKPANLF